EVQHYKQRNLCVVLAVMAANYAAPFKCVLFDETVHFLTRIISDEKSHKTAKLFAIIFLECLVIEKSNWKKLKLRKENVSEKLNEMAQQEINYYDLVNNVD